jgi:ATP-dependent DNA helicase RecQ
LTLASFLGQNVHMNTAAEQPREVLSRVFGYQEFRVHQESVVTALLAGRDVFALMPTGGGKSLCYQLPSLLMDECVVVVSPLIALSAEELSSYRAPGVAPEKRQ